MNTNKEALIEKNGAKLFATCSTCGIILGVCVFIGLICIYYYYLISSLEEISLQRVLNECDSSGPWICPIITGILLIFNFLSCFNISMYDYEDYFNNCEIIRVIFKITFLKILACAIDIILFIWNIYEISSNCIEDFNSSTLFSMLITNIFLLILLIILLIRSIYKV